LQSYKKYGKGWSLKKKYVITQNDKDQLALAQNGACAICAAQAFLVVDPDHHTLEVRGLLCSECNRGLGAFFDSPDHLRNAASYLESEYTGLGRKV
jgi:hypothetical protein